MYVNVCMYRSISISISVSISILFLFLFPFLFLCICIYIYTHTHIVLRRRASAPLPPPGFAVIQYVERGNPKLLKGIYSPKGMYQRKPPNHLGAWRHRTIETGR